MPIKSSLVVFVSRLKIAITLDRSARCSGRAGPPGFSSSFSDEPLR